MQLESGAWSPYLVGTLIGLLSMATFYFSNKPLSVSTAYARLAGMVGTLFSKGHTENLKYYQDTRPKIEWGVMLVFGMLLGAFISAVTGGEFSSTWVPALWEQRFGPDVILRLGVAFLGGAISAYGARLAGGCTSGHGISGALQLSVGSWVALVCFFVGAVATSHLLYRL
ncbi:YeeE/YedE thiosulfate transporter family protein [Hydrogenophaga sp.]|uniref:YeeE/YedE thiosulfate transporter family protein n=1 Tax=Hydrogenophaga sp. TaxID=1904254 RepID=UPI00272083D9|nr:YeeE/YedE thiosulfate transporter family protein [Hydrogenophaga sp.]MDO8906769.1 YeeE/YedE thiosulfate transporter family protein [Hydrogenophaga sp.]